MARNPIAWVSAAGVVFLCTTTNAFHSSPAGKIGAASSVYRRHRCQGLEKLAASPMDKFMSGLSDMINGETPEDAEQDSAETMYGQAAAATQDMDGFRSGLIKQTSKKKKQDFTGYDMYDLIVDKFDVPYDVQINKTVFAGKPVLCLNVMWKYLGQSSFHLSEQEYLEHLQALAELLQEWDRVDHFKRAVADTKKRPNPYFGYAVALPLDLAPDTLAGYFDDSYF
eukprot:jgi/Undpi1/8558/HiC_scaffold_25.g11023.m1